MVMDSKEKVKDEERYFWQSIEAFLVKYEVHNGLWMAREGKIEDGKIGKYQTKFFAQLNTPKHDEAIKHLKKNGWKAERKKYDKFGNDIYESDTVILSYTPYKFL